METVPKEEFDKIKSQFDAVSAKINEQNAKSEKLATELAARDKELEEIRTKEKTESGNFKDLYENSKTENEKLKAEKKKLLDGVQYNEKYKTVQNKLLESGLRKDAVHLLDKEPLDEVIVEHTSEGRMLVNGADEYVDKFKKKFAFAFEEKKSVKVNSGGGGNKTVVTDEEFADIDSNKLYAIEREETKKAGGDAQAGRRSERYQKAYKALLEKKTKRG